MFDLRHHALLTMEKRGGILEAARKVSGLMRDINFDGAVIGGVAVVLHGHLRTTADVDVLIRVPAALMRTVLEKAGAKFHATRKEFILDGVAVHLVTEDIAQPPPKRFVVMEGISTISLADLLNLKLRSGLSHVARAQDIADVIGLIRHHKLTATFASQIEKSMRAEFRALAKAAFE